MSDEKLPYLTFKELREARGFATQQSLATACEVSQAAIHKIETGVLSRLPHSTTLWNLCVALNVTEAQLTPILVFGRGLPSERKRKQEEKAHRVAEKAEVGQMFGRAEWQEWRDNDLPCPTLWNLRRHTLLTKDELAARAAKPLPPQPTPDERRAMAIELHMPVDGSEIIRVRFAAARQGVQTRRRGYALATDDPRGPTQEEIVARCGISLQAYRNIERGAASPHESTLAALTKAFGVDSKYMRQILIATKLAAEDRARRKQRKKELGTLKEQAERMGPEALDDYYTYIDAPKRRRPRGVAKQFDKLGTDPR